MGEILFGLIMTLTFTLGAGLVVEEQGREGARQILLGVLGCNVAWGIIDGVFYVLGEVFERGRLRRVALRIRESTSPGEARSLVASELDDLLSGIANDNERDRLYGSIAERVRVAEPGHVRLQGQDILGGLASAWLVIACSLPAVLPFLVFDDPGVALRVSNAVLLALLFVVGHRVGRLTLARPWLTGAVFAVFGLGLVLLSMALGG
jgi:VIT1/CCC1 family predicted Fe2+/Mn2+ transporter